MTKTNMDLSGLLAKHDQGYLLRSIAEAVRQMIIEAGVNGLIGAGRLEHNGGRTTWRNGYRDRFLDTRFSQQRRFTPRVCEAYNFNEMNGENVRRDSR